MTKVLVTKPLIDSALTAIQTRGFDLDVANGLDRAGLLELVREYDAIISMLSDKFDEEIFDRAKGGPLRIVANYAVGYDNLDLIAARNVGICVTNTPHVLTEATAEMAWTLVFSAARCIVEGDALARSGRWQGWEPTQFVGVGISGKTVGVVGAGRIGRAFAAMGKGFGIKILYFATRRNEELEQSSGAEFRNLDDLLGESDIVSIHLPKNPNTIGMISAERIALMKPTVLLVNTGRGVVIDESALARALKEGRIAAAGLDVYEHEPIIHPELLSLPNVVLAPHLGSATRESRTAMAERCADNIVAACKGEQPPDALKIKN